MDQESGGDKSGWPFGRLLDWHIQRGTRPASQPAEPELPWRQHQFAEAIGRDPKSVYLWVVENQRPLTGSYQAIERALFGDNPAHADFRRELKVAYNRCFAGIDAQAAVSTHPTDAAKAEDLGASLLAAIQTGANGRILQELSTEYRHAAHPLIRRSLEYLIWQGLQSLIFSRQRGPTMNHSDFGMVTVPYIEGSVRHIRALTRSSVTNWGAHNAAGKKYLAAQEGKDVCRIFVLRSMQEYRAFAADVLLEHASCYGAECVFVCSERAAASVVEHLPHHLRIGPSEDFAIYDNDIVAMCTGPEHVAFRTDRLAACTEVFEAILQFVETRQQSFADLVKAPERAEAIFRTIKSSHQGARSSKL